LPTFASKKSSRRVRRIVIGVGTVIGIGVIANCGTGSERNRVEDDWSRLTAPQRALACWSRNGLKAGGGTSIGGVAHEVLNANCPDGEAQAITAHAPLGEEVEREYLELGKSTYEASPAKPEEFGLTDADLPNVCPQSAQELAATPGLREFLVFPWEGTGYFASHDFAVGVMQIMLDSVCE